MTFGQLLLIGAGWALKSSLSRTDGSAADKLSSTFCIATAIACLYFGLSR